MNEEELHVRVQKKLELFEKQMMENERTIEAIWNEFLTECDRQLVNVHATVEAEHAEAAQNAQKGFERAQNALIGLENAQQRRMAEAKERLQSFSDTVKFVYKDFLENVEEEKRRQKDAETRIGELIEDVEKNVEARLREEEALGQKTHSNLLQLLETACAKIERSFMLN